MGKLYKAPEQPLTHQAFALRQLSPVGTYAIQPTWGDGHATGIYSFEYLRQICQLAE
jgi:DUF971 family protein